MRGLGGIIHNSKTTARGFSGRIALLFLITAFILAFITGQADAASLVGAWQITEGDATASNHSYTPGAGTNRMVIIAISNENMNTGDCSTINQVSLGSSVLTPITEVDVGTCINGYNNMLWMGYLDEAGIASRGTDAITVTWTQAPNFAYDNPKLTAATYSDVVQATPVFQTGTANTGATVSLSANIAWAEGDQVIYAMEGGQPGTTVAATGYTEQVTLSGAANGHSLSISQKNVKTPLGNEGITGDPGITSRHSLIAATLEGIPIDTLSTSSNTDLSGGNPIEGSTVMMQSFQVDTTNTDYGNNQVILNSLTMQDDGNATSISTVNIYIDTTNGTCGNTQLIGTTTSWNGASTAITLDQGTRTVDVGTSKWICVEYVIPVGQGNNTVQSNVTALDVVNWDIGATSVGTSTSRTVQIPPDVLTADQNTAILASNPTVNDTGLVMQRIRLTSSNVTDGQVELNSLTLDDIGTAGTIAAARVYISTTSSSTLPGDAVDIGNTTSWDGTSTAITLNGGSTANRTVTNGTPKYIYIIYDLGSGTFDIQSSVTAVGVVAGDTGASGLTYNSNALSIVVDSLTASAAYDMSTGQPDAYEAGYEFLRFTVNSDNVADGKVIINSLTMQDDGDATGLTVKIYNSTVSNDTTLPGGATLLATESSWAGGSTAITLTDAEVSNGTPQYIYIVYDPIPASAGSTIKPQVTAVGVSGGEGGETGLTFTTALRTIQSCTDGTPSTLTIGASGTASGAPYNAFRLITGDTGNIMDDWENFTYFVGFTGSAFEEWELFDTADTNNDYGPNWLPTDINGTDESGSETISGFLWTHVSTVVGTGASCTSAETLTGSADTGPCVLDTGTGFLYLETSAGTNADRYYTRQGALSADDYELYVSFNAHTLGAEMPPGGVQFQVNQDSGGWVTEWAQYDQANYDIWNSVSVDLYNGTGVTSTQYRSGDIEMRFYFIYGLGYLGDAAIDTIHITGKPRVFNNWETGPNIAATIANGAGADYTGGIYNVTARGTDPDCGGSTTTSNAQDFTWSGCADSDASSTLTMVNPGSNIGGQYTFQASAGSEDSPGGFTNVEFYINGSWEIGVWNSSTTKYEYYSSTVSDYPNSTTQQVTDTDVKVRGDDPDCGALRLSSAISVTVDNQTTTTIGDGSDPAATPSLCPGDPITDMDAFTVQTDQNTDSITALQVNFSSVSGVGFVNITSNDNATTYGSQASPSDPQSVTLGTNISATTSQTPYKVRIVPMSHAAMPAVPGGSYSISGIVDDITVSKQETLSDADSDTVSIDNLSTGNGTWGTVTPSDSQVALNWTNPGDGDFNGVLIVRDTGTISWTPTEGTTYSDGQGLGGNLTVAHVGAGISNTDSGLTNNQDYYYRMFAKDNCGNYSQTGVETGPHTPEVTVTVGDSSVTADNAASGSDTGITAGGFTLGVDVGSDTVTEIIVTFGGTPSDIASSGAHIYLDDGDNVFDGGDTEISGSPVSLSGATATFTTSEGVTTTTKTYIIVIDTIASPGNGDTINAYVSGVTASNTIANLDNTDGNITIDATAPS